MALESKMGVCVGTPKQWKQSEKKETIPFFRNVFVFFEIFF